MFKHALLLTYRNFLRHTGFFLINLASLTLGLTVALLIFLWVDDELKMDHFHKQDKQLYQVLKNAQTPDGKTLTFTWTPTPLAQELKDRYPEVEYAVTSLIENGNKGIAKNKDLKIKAEEIYASADFFNAFSFELLEGRASEIFEDKNKVAISDELALQLFDRDYNLIGETIEWEREDSTAIFTISGVFAAPPRRSTLQFDLLFPFEKYIDLNPGVTEWSYADPDTYVVLKNGSNLADFNEKIAGLLQEKTQEDYQYLFATKFSDRYLYGNYVNGQAEGGRIGYVRLFSILALMILVIACINFMNLSTARASKRSREIGVKKAFGVQKRMLVVQHLIEAFYMVAIAMMVSFLLSYILLPYFNAITEKPLQLDWQPDLILKILLIGLLASLFAGSYPAFYLSNIKAINILKDKLKHSGGALFIRKALVVFQFTISTVLIIMVFIISQQISYVQSKPLGYEKDNLITFKKEGGLEQQTEAFLTDIKGISGVMNASNLRYDLMQNDTRTTAVNWEGKSPEKEVVFKYIATNFDGLETIEVNLNQGRFFSKAYGEEEYKVIFNQAAIDQMGINNPIGKSVRIGGVNREIIGTVDNFHFESLYEEVAPCFIFLDPRGDNFLVRISSGSEKAVIAQLETAYQKYNPGLPFEFEFLDETYQRYYNAELRIAQLSTYASIFAILISCLGLLGLVIFTAEQRQKEIGIRKVLGASIYQLTQLITKDFLILVGISVLIAVPLAYYLANNWLEHFAYTINLNLWYFALAAICVVFIAFLIISVQTIRAALANPVDVLKLE